MIYLILGLHLLGQHFWSPDELKDTHIGRMACIWNCMCMQVLSKLHEHATVHAIFEEMQLCQYGVLSNRLDFRNADPKKVNQLHIECWRSDWIFLCIFSNLICIYKNSRQQFVIAPIALQFLLVLNYVLKQLCTNYQIPIQHFWF